MSGPGLLPPLGPETEPFLDGTREGELRIPRCVDTGRWVFPPRATSPHGDHRPLEWVAVSGRGTIWSYAVPHPPLLPPYDEMAPYNVVLVALEEEPTVRLVGNLVRESRNGLERVDPNEVVIGAPVRVVFERVTDDVHLPRWVLDPDGPASRSQV